MPGVTNTPLGKAAEAFQRATEDFNSAKTKAKEEFEKAEQDLIKELAKANKTEIRVQNKRFVLVSSPSKQKIKIKK